MSEDNQIPQGGVSEQGQGFSFGLGSGSGPVGGDTLSSAYAVDAIVSAQLIALDALTEAPAVEAVPLCVTVNAPDGTRHAIVLAAGARITNDKALCEAVRDAALAFRPSCAAVIEYVDDDTRRIYSL